MQGIGHDVLLILVLVYKRSAYAQIGICLLQGLDPLLQTNLHVGTRDPRVIQFPVATLLPRQHLHDHSRHRLIYQSAAKQCIVDAQTALLVGAEDEARAKLVIDATCRQFQILVMALDKGVSYAPATHIMLIARQRML